MTAKRIEEIETYVGLAVEAVANQRIIYELLAEIKALQNENRSLYKEVQRLSRLVIHKETE